jgi:AraC family transcriptional regulator of adaptative response/methylated-DNA-[protein]-cysteine methyltransferase
MKTRTIKNGDRESHFATDAARWQAVLRRDAAADGRFYYSVRTTGIYCRPSCGSRTAKRENVQFYDSTADAEKCGFRPCKRCRPDAQSQRERYGSIVGAACRAIRASEEPPSLAFLAKTAGLSAFHFHRIFRKVTGLSPKAYAATHRAEQMRNALKKRNTVTEAIYDAGYNSNSRFYEKMPEILGMKAKKFQQNGRGAAIDFALGKSSLGAVLAAKSEKGVCAILIGDDAKELVQDLRRRFPEASLIAGDKSFERVVQRAVELVEAPGTHFELPLDIRGTVFQRKVWMALRDIPAGTTTTYAAVARGLGLPKSVRAVAGAIAANPIAVAVPCHRVLRSNGELSGYRWGQARKRELLARERRVQARRREIEDRR